MVMCAIVGCSNRSKSKARANSSNTSLFRLPTVVTNQCERTKELTARRRSMWLSRIKRADLNPNNPNIRVCGAHFVTGRPAKLWEEAHPDWAPSLALGYARKRGCTERSERLNQRRAVKKTAEADAAAVVALDAASSQPMDPSYNGDVAAVPDRDGGVNEHENETGIAVQTDLTMGDMAALEQQCVALNDRIHAQQNEIERLQLTEEAFRTCKTRVTFYTGMGNFALLLALFSQMEGYVAHCANSLTKFQEFVLFLVKLKLNLQNLDLAFRFGVSESAVSRIFHKWLHVAYCRLKSQIVWPGRDVLQRTMPQAFCDSFQDNLAVIIDCFELKIERPSSFLLRSETWSQCKGSNTAKYLIGIAPQAVVTFISEGWGGRASDKHITEHCGLLDNLLPGDVVLADQSFNMSESVGFYCARLHIPAFTKGKRQLSAEEVEDTRKLSNVQIHVERVIGLIRNKFDILKSVLPVEYVAHRPGDDVTPIDKIVTVCCALSNLCPSIVAEQIEANYGQAS